MGASILYAAAVIGIVGILAGILLGVASEKFKVKVDAVSYTHLRAHETDSYLVCRLLLEKKKQAHKTRHELVSN